MDATIMKTPFFIRLYMTFCNKYNPDILSYGQLLSLFYDIKDCTAPILINIQDIFYYTSFPLNKIPSKYFISFGSTVIKNKGS